MPGLIERIDGLSRKMQLLAASRVTEAEAIGFRDRAKELSELAARLVVPTQRLMSLSKRGIRVDTPVPISRTLMCAIDEKAREYEADRRSILNPDPNWRHSTKNQLIRLAESIDARLREAWGTYVSEITPGVDPGLMMVLRDSPGYADEVKKVRRLRAALEDAKRRLPTSMEEIDQPNKLAVQLRRAMENLPADIPSPVLDLFTEINQGTATARHLTGEVLAWLHQKKMLDAIAISWRSR